MYGYYHFERINNMRDIHYRVLSLTLSVSIMMLIYLHT